MPQTRVLSPAPGPSPKRSPPDCSHPISYIITMIETKIIGKLLRQAANNPEVTASLIAALLGGITSYKRTGRIPLGRIPFRYVRRMFKEFGDTYFGKSRPKGVPAIIVDSLPKEIESELRTRHYESGDLFSYELEGEVWNLRRPEQSNRHPESGAMVPMETHIRSFETSEGKTLILAHYEANRQEAPELHLDESMFSRGEGLEQIKRDLDALEISYIQIDSESEAEIEIVS